MKKPKMGRPPLPEAERGKRVNVYLSAAALAAVDALTGDETMSALISRLLVEAAKKKKRARARGEDGEG